MEMQILSPTGNQANYFKTFVTSLVQKFQPLQLFCFAKTSLLEETNGCFIDQKTDHHCNYCLLMVTETNTRIDHEVQDFSSYHYKKGTISILCHGQESIEEAIRGNNRFFMTVYTKGQLLYSRDGMSHFDFTRKFIPTHSAKKAQKHFDHRLPLAEGFLRGAGECLVQRDFNISTFMLHQVVEQCCILLISVHLAYRSEIHNLQRMLRLCSSFSDKPIKMFLSGSTEDERLFDLLIKSYSGSRYGTNFSVKEQDAQNLHNRITCFVLLVKGMCLEKIKQLDIESLLHKEILTESEVING